MRLTSDHSLGKINHHVGLTGSNKVSLSHAEVLAIKDAFVRSLSQNGVPADEINRIRRSPTPSLCSSAPGWRVFPRLWEARHCFP